MSWIAYQQAKFDAARRMSARPALGADEGDGLAVVTAKGLLDGLSYVGGGVDSVIGFVVGTNEAQQSAKAFAAALRADTENLRKAWPAGPFTFTLPALKDYVDALYKIPGAAIDAGLAMANDVSNVLVSEEYFRVIRTIQATQERNLRPISDLVVSAQRQALERGIPQSRWHEIKVTSSDIRRLVFKMLSDVAGAWEAFGFLEGIKPNILRTKVAALVIEGLSYIGAVAVAVAKATGVVLRTFNDLVDAGMGAFDWAIKLAQASAIAGGAYLVFQALKKR